MTPPLDREKERRLMDLVTKYGHAKIEQALYTERFWRVACEQTLAERPKESTR